jgi:uncharacterized protein
MTSTDTTPASFDAPLAVDPRTISVWRWTAVIASMPVVVALAAAVSAWTGTEHIVAVPWLIGGVALVAIVVLVAWYPGARYRHLRYRVDDVGIVVRFGVIWRTQAGLPRIRIQHTDVSQGPIQRRYGVATLKLYTAGSRFTRTDLPGLEYGAAVALRDDLQRSMHADAV